MARAMKAYPKDPATRLLIYFLDHYVSLRSRDCRVNFIGE